MKNEGIQSRQVIILSGNNTNYLYHNESTFGVRTCTKILRKIMSFKKIAKTFCSIFRLFFKIIL